MTGRSKCRYSDAAFIGWEATPQEATPQLGRIARTEFYTGSKVISHTNPRFTITGTANLQVGQAADKVGWRTGWTWGFVSATCIDFKPSSDPSVALLCQTRVTGNVNPVALGGDSGAPVFRWLTGNSVELVGIASGANLANNYLFYGPFANIEQDYGTSISVAF